MSKKKEGDIWEDSKGNRWQKKNGYKVKLSKKDTPIRDLIKRICPECKKDIDMFGDKLDNKFFSKTGRCYECVEKEEMYMRVTGEFKDYENLKLAQNKLSMLREFRTHLLSSIEYLEKDESKLSFVNSDGSIDTWTTAQNKSLLEEIKEDLIKTDNEIKVVEESISNNSKSL